MKCLRSGLHPQGWWLQRLPAARAPWQKFLDRGYSKAADGLAVAKEMKQPPAELMKVMAFASESGKQQEA